MTLKRAFGFEAEYGDHVWDTLTVLHKQGLAATDEMHSYHCSCEWCDYNSDSVFRGQNDSSCGGEIISYPFDDYDDALDAMLALQNAAVEADASVDTTAGFHVHVSAGFHETLDMDGLPGSRLLAKAWMPFEHWLRQEVAPGALANYRGFNYSLCRLVTTHLYESSPEALNEAIRCVVRSGERHVTLNMTMGSGRVEYRIWNATLSAWRMEMYARLSVLFTMPDFVEEAAAWFDEHLCDAAAVQAWSDAVRADTHAVTALDVDRDAALWLIEKHEPRAAELLRRHIAWREKAGELPVDSIDDLIEGLDDDVNRQADPFDFFRLADIPSPRRRPRPLDREVQISSERPSYNDLMVDATVSLGGARAAIRAAAQEAGVDLHNIGIALDPATWTVATRVVDPVPPRPRRVTSNGAVEDCTCDGCMAARAEDEPDEWTDYYQGQEGDEVF